MPPSGSTATTLTLLLLATMATVAPGELAARRAEPISEVSAAPGHADDGAADDASAAAARLEILDRRPGDGEQCLVCSLAIEGETVVAVRYKGRLFHVKESMLEELRRDPDAYFRKLQARSGLFDEEAVGPRPPRTGWMAVGLYVVAGLVCGALSFGLALRRSRRALPWFFAGLAGNVLALGALVLAGPGADGSRALPAGLAKIPSTRAPLPCPGCGAPNHPAAEACTSCGAALAPAVEAEIDRGEEKGS